MTSQRDVNQPGRTGFSQLIIRVSAAEASVPFVDVTAMMRSKKAFSGTMAHTS